MKQNIAGTGRIARGLVGVVIIAAGWHYQSWWGALGIIPLGEAAFGWCALRHICGAKDCKKE